MKDVKIYEEFIIQNQKNERFKILSKNLINRAKEFYNPEYIFENEEYKELISLGKDIVPLIVEEFLKTQNGIWVTTLHDITNLKPYEVKPKTSKDFINGWLNWCKNDYKEWLKNQ